MSGDGTMRSLGSPIAPVFLGAAPATIGLHLEAANGVVTLAREGVAVSVPLERVGDVAAFFARVYDAQVSGELPRTRAAALAAQGVPEGLAGYAPKPCRGAPPPSGKPPQCPSCEGPLDADRRCGLCDLGGRR